MCRIRVQQLLLEGADVQRLSVPGGVGASAPTEQQHRPLGGQRGFEEVHGGFGRSPDRAVPGGRMRETQIHQAGLVSQREATGDLLGVGAPAASDAIHLADPDAAGHQRLNGLGAQLLQQLG